MRIGEVAKAAEINVQTVRFYEKRGLLGKPVRLVSGYRNYTPETVQMLRFIKQSKEIGFTLDEIKQLLKLREKPAGNSLEVRSLAESKLSRVEDQIERLNGMRNELKHILAICECGKSKTRCPALDALDHSINR